VGQAFEPVHTGWKARATPLKDQEKISQFVFLEVPLRQIRKTSPTCRLVFTAAIASAIGFSQFHLTPLSLKNAVYSLSVPMMCVVNQLFRKFKRS